MAAMPVCMCGITPAHAGKRTAAKILDAAHKDHPRACGEKLEDGTVRRYEEGSPPRMRGKVKLLPINLVMMRITPAHAGKSGTDVSPLSIV